MQLSFDLEPRKLARRRDPITSHQAAGRVAEFSHAHHATILRVLAEHGPCTAHEIADHSGLEMHAVARRMKELQGECAVGIVLDGQGAEMTRKTPSGRSARVWYRVGVA